MTCYSFLADYLEAWKWLREGLVACSEQGDKARVLAEYKINEPRTHCFVSTAAKVLPLLQGSHKPGVLLDAGLTPLPRLRTLPGPGGRLRSHAVSRMDGGLFPCRPSRGGRQTHGNRPGCGAL